MGVHPTAQLHSEADIGNNVKIGPYCCIDKYVKIGDGTELAEHCIVKGRTTIGKNCHIFTGAVIGSIPQDLKYDQEETYLTIGDRNVIREYVTINTGTAERGETTIGDDNMIMAYAHIAHDSIIRNNVIMANVGTLAGHVIIEDNAIIGGLAAIHQFVRIGKLAIVGGCAKVVQDAPPFTIFDGHPAKVRGINSVGLRRAGYSKEQRMNLKSTFKKLFKSKLSLSTAIEQLESSTLSKEEKYLIDFIKNSKRGIGR